jgi:hypothetical protein
MCLEHLMTWKFRGETEIIGENLRHYHLIYHKSHLRGDDHYLSLTKINNTEFIHRWLMYFCLKKWMDRSLLDNSVSTAGIIIIRLNNVTMDEEGGDLSLAEINVPCAASATAGNSVCRLASHKVAISVPEIVRLQTNCLCCEDCCAHR